MSENTELAEIDLNKVILKKYTPDDLTLPVDAAAEMTRSFLFISNVISEMEKDTRIDTIETEDGRTLRKTFIHPHLLEWIKERRATLELVHKFTGGELSLEQKKEQLKLFGKLIYDMSNTPEAKKRLFEEWKKQSFKKSTETR